MSSKLRKQGAKSSLKREEKPADPIKPKNLRITTAKESINTTYKINPVTMRLSLTDKKALSDWVDELQAKTQRKVTPAKIMRGLLSLQDEIDQDKLLSIIKEMN